MTQTTQYDAFISYASEDRGFVSKLVQFLFDLGIKVWFAEFELAVGDSISKSIDKGLSNSNFGIVVLSDSFLEKFWTDYEFRSLLELKRSGKSNILPIYHNLSNEKLLKYSPNLAGTFALNSADEISSICLKLVKVIRPDKYDGISSYLKYRQMIETQQTQQVKMKPANEFNLSTSFKRQKLSDSQLYRIHIILELLKDIRQSSIETMYQNFLRDLDVNQEISLLEQVALVLTLYRQKTGCTLDTAKYLFTKLLYVNLPKLIQSISTNPSIFEEFEEWFENDEVDKKQLLEIIKSITTHPPTD